VVVVVELPAELVPPGGPEVPVDGSAVVSTLSDVAVDSPPAGATQVHAPSSRHMLTRGAQA